MTPNVLSFSFYKKINPFVGVLMEYLSAALAKSGPLDIPSEKISIFNFNP